MPGSSLVYTDQLPGRTLVAGGEEYLFFSGTSYFGIPHNPEFRSFLLEGMIRYGTNYSSSRNSNLRLRVFDEAEAYLASWACAEAALTMSSGYMAGQLVIRSLEGTGSFLYAPGAHPAVCRTPQDMLTAETDFEEWADSLTEKIGTISDDHIIIVCNSLDPLKAKDHSFHWVASLPENKKYTLLVDDSHGLGVTGKNGAGCFELLSTSLPFVRLIVVGSLGKALGIPAGAILGKSETIEQLRSSAYFGGASPAVPAYLFAFLQGEKVFNQARQQLFQNITYFSRQVEQPGLFSSFEHYPVFSTASSSLCPYLLQHNIMISSFRYPTPADAPITRVIINSLHTTEDLNQLILHINQFGSVAST